MKYSKSFILILSISVLVAVSEILTGTVDTIYVLLEQFFITVSYALLFLFSCFPVMQSHSIIQLHLRLGAFCLLFFLEISLFFECFLYFRQTYLMFNSSSAEILLICQNLNDLFHFFIQTSAQKLKDVILSLPFI